MKISENQRREIPGDENTAGWENYVRIKVWRGNFWR